MENFEDSVRRHQADWAGFAKLMFWSGLFCVIVLVLMAIFLV